MLGPVYALEWQQATRRVQKYPWRWIYAGVLLLEGLWLALGALEYIFTRNAARLGFLAEGLLRLVVAQQTVAILFVAPAFAAGSITDEKRRRTLDFLLTTPLSSAEIIFGKWLGQATQVLHLISPAYALLAVLAGTINESMSFLLWSVAQQIALIYAVTALSLLASTWSRSTAKAIVGVYVFFGIILCTEWMADLPLIGRSLSAFPLGVELPFKQNLASLAMLILLTVLALALSAWRLRPAQERQQDATGRVAGRWWDRPSIGNAPMRWKERFIGDWFSVPVWRVLPRWLKCVLLASLIASLALTMPEMETFILLGTLQFFLSGLFVAIRAAGAITGEHENQTWDSLLTTQMDAYQIVRGKLWGQIDALRPYLLAYLLPAVVGAVVTSAWAAAWIAYTWLASWIFLYYLGAIGISCSMKATSTWRSILTTLTVGNYSLFFTATIFGLLAGSAAVGILSLTSLMPGGRATAMSLGTLALGSAPGLLWIFAHTEEVLQQAQEEFTRRTAIDSRARFPLK